MKKIIKVEFILFLIFNNFLFSQDSLLNQIDDNSEEYAIEISAFKAHKIINSQSTKQSNKDRFIVKAFQRRFLPNEVDGRITDKTLKISQLLS